MLVIERLTASSRRMFAGDVPGVGNRSPGGGSHGEPRASQESTCFLGFLTLWGMRMPLSYKRLRRIQHFKVSTIAHGGPYTWIGPHGGPYALDGDTER